MPEGDTLPADPFETPMVEQLTNRELQVLHLVALGCRNQDIAAKLRVSIKTVEFHMSNIRGKLCARSRTDAVVRAGRIGLLQHIFGRR